MAASVTTARSYAQVAHTNVDAEYGEERKSVLFLKQSDVVKAETKQWLKGEEILVGIAEVVPIDNIDGLQRIRGLWRIYPKDNADKLILLQHGLSLRGKAVELWDKNPFRRELHEDGIKITVKDLPLSLDDRVIEGALTALGLKIKSRVNRQRWRINGKLTNICNGDRTVFAEKPSKELPKFTKVGLFTARLFINAQNQSEAVCNNCLQPGHYRSRCTNPTKCRICLGCGHLAKECVAQKHDKQTVPIVKSVETTLSMAVTNGLNTDAPQQPITGLSSDEGTLTSRPSSIPAEPVLVQPSQSSTPTDNEQRDSRQEVPRSRDCRRGKTGREPTSSEHHITQRSITSFFTENRTVSSASLRDDCIRDSDSHEDESTNISESGNEHFVDCDTTKEEMSDLSPESPPILRSSSNTESSGRKKRKRKRKQRKR